MTASISKVDLRQQLRKQRQSLSEQFRITASLTIIKKLIDLPLWHSCNHIALYLPNDNEVDISTLLTIVPQKDYYLPILTPSKALQFAHYRDDDVLQANKLGIPEPVRRDIRLAQDLDLVCVPLVGFDAHGARLGMGGGYYDRTFSFKKQGNAHAPYLIGIAYECQKVLALPHEEWDIDLYGVLTEQNYYWK